MLKDVEDLSPVIAQQQYLAFAQTQLAIAPGKRAGGFADAVPPGQAADWRWPSKTSDPQMLHGPQAMVYYQAALAADDRNYLAANELGVLMAQLWPAAGSPPPAGA